MSNTINEKMEQIYEEWLEHMAINGCKTIFNKGGKPVCQLQDADLIKKVAIICLKYNITLFRYISIILRKKNIEPPFYWYYLGRDDVISYVENYFQKKHEFLQREDVKQYIRDAIEALVNQGTPREKAVEITLNRFGIKKSNDYK